MLSAVAQLGLVLFMFLVGFEFDLADLWGSGRVVAVVSTSSIVVPFCLGVGLVAVLWRAESGKAG